jgi:hypothetical protein
MGTLVCIPKISIDSEAAQCRQPRIDAQSAPAMQALRAFGAAETPCHNAQSSPEPRTP